MRWRRAFYEASYSLGKSLQAVVLFASLTDKWKSWLSDASFLTSEGKAANVLSLHAQVASAVSFLGVFG